MQSMMENMPINVLYADTDLNLRYMNPASIKQLKTVAALAAGEDRRHDRQIDRHLPQESGTPAANAGGPQESCRTAPTSAGTGDAGPAGQRDLRQQGQLHGRRWSPGMSSPRSWNWRRRSSRTPRLVVVGRRADRDQPADGGQRRRDGHAGQRSLRRQRRGFQERQRRGHRLRRDAGVYPRDLQERQ